jgi:hypothetical protein
MELLLSLMSIIDMPLQMGFGPESLATVRVRAFVIFRMISLMMPVGLTSDFDQPATINLLELVWLVEHLVTARLITCV